MGLKFGFLFSIRKPRQWENATGGDSQWTPPGIGSAPGPPHQRRVTPGWASTITPCGCIRASVSGRHRAGTGVERRWPRPARDRCRLCRDPGQRPGNRVGLGAPAHLWRLRCGDGGGGRARDQRLGPARCATAGRPGGHALSARQIPPGFQITGRYDL